MSLELDKDLIFVEVIEDREDLQPESLPVSKEIAKLEENFVLFYERYNDCVVKKPVYVFSPYFTSIGEHFFWDMKILFADSDFQFKVNQNGDIISTAKTVDCNRLVCFGEVPPVSIEEMHRFPWSTKTVVLFDNGIFLNEATGELHWFSTAHTPFFKHMRDAKHEYKENIDEVFSKPYRYIHPEDPFLLVEDLVYEKLNSLTEQEKWELVDKAFIQIVSNSTNKIKFKSLRS